MRRLPPVPVPVRVPVPVPVPVPLLLFFSLSLLPAPAHADPDRTLPIPARSQASESPPSGWCGETAIQEGLLHVGVWAPQRIINKAGNPAHADLYSPELPVALANLGVRFTAYPGPRGYEPFAKWARAAIDDGDPVIAGVKILPTAHPEWGLDHFVTVVGYGDKGLLVNTTWGHREWVSDKATKGLSLANALYGLRLRGVTGGAKPARLTVLDESGENVTLRVTCTGAADREAVVPASKVARFSCAS